MVVDAVQQMAETRVALAQKLEFTDANIWLGLLEDWRLGEELEVQRLGAVLSQYFIVGGLVSHWRAKTYSAQDGNETLAAILPSLPTNLYGVYTGLPLMPREQGMVFCGDALPPRVRGIRLFPATHNFPLAS